MNCRFHPDREARVRCNKMAYGYCEECLASCVACTDPELYCKDRRSCIIWESWRAEIRKRKAESNHGGETPEVPGNP